MKTSAARKTFMIFNYTFLCALAFICIFPFINLLAISFSKSSAVDAGAVSVLPVGFNTSSYEFVIGEMKFWRAFFISIKRELIGVTLNLVFMILTAYPLSRTKEEFRHRTFFSWFFVFTMMFGGGLIPTYLVIMKLKLIDNIWALILPGILPVHNMILLMNFFRNTPHEIEEAAMIDGAGVLRTLVKVVIPIAKPGLATVALFCIVRHWNSWFDGMVYMNNTSKYPLQSYLRTLIVDFETLMSQSNNVNMKQLLSMMNARTGRAAQLFVATIPIMLVYPLLSKYFTKGLVMGSVKG